MDVNRKTLQNHELKRDAKKSLMKTRLQRLLSMHS